MVQIHQFPAFEDNYIYLLEDGTQALVVDPGDSKPVLDFLSGSDLKLAHILNTHHHPDHVGGNEALVEKTGAQVIGFHEDQHRIPLISQTLQDGETITILGLSFQVLHVPGHTTGHIAFYVPALKALFCGDTLFSLGCGRLFEGTPEQMWTSLQRLCALPDETLVFCAHEYTLQNARFAQSLDPEDSPLNLHIEKASLKRAKNQPTIPSLLRDEKRYNPFLKADSPQEFARLRELKDTFF
ncbi:MAG: hydroxyacylglutathione hydrolase [bacterium]|nr:hydroxyacylglutathione hydrolase [bacterium]